MRHSIAGEIWKGRGQSLQERVPRVQGVEEGLQTTITYAITRWNDARQNSVLSLGIQQPPVIFKTWPVSLASRT
jgi:hypothetical protein